MVKNRMSLLETEGCGNDQPVIKQRRKKPNNKQRQTQEVSEQFWHKDRRTKVNAPAKHLVRHSLNKMQQLLNAILFCFVLFVCLLLFELTEEWVECDRFGDCEKASTERSGWSHNKAREKTLFQWRRKGTNKRCPQTRRFALLLFVRRSERRPRRPPCLMRVSVSPLPASPAGQQRDL